MYSQNRSQSFIGANNAHQLAATVNSYSHPQVANDQASIYIQRYHQTFSHPNSLPISSPTKSLLGAPPEHHHQHHHQQQQQHQHHQHAQTLATAQSQPAHSQSHMSSTSTPSIGQVQPMMQQYQNFAYIQPQQAVTHQNQASLITLTSTNQRQQINNVTNSAKQMININNRPRFNMNKSSDLNNNNKKLVNNNTNNQTLNIKTNQQRLAQDTNSQAYLQKLKTCIDSNRRNINQTINHNINSGAKSLNNHIKHDSMSSSSSSSSSSTSASSHHQYHTTNKQLIVIKPADFVEQKSNTNTSMSSVNCNKRSLSLNENLTNQQATKKQNVSESSTSVDITKNKSIVSMHGVLFERKSENDLMESGASKNENELFKVKINLYYCKLCNCLILNDMPNLKQHLISMEHKNNEAASITSSTCTKQPNASSTDIETIDESKTNIDKQQQEQQEHQQRDNEESSIFVNIKQECK